jgi:hypothetical protein
MHIPLNVVSQYYHATEGTGSCAVILLAQIRYFALTREEAVVPNVTTTKKARDWFKEMVEPLNEFCGPPENWPAWRLAVDKVWKKYGLDGGKVQIKTDTSEYVDIDSLVEMIKLLDIEVNLWLSCSQEGPDDIEATGYGLVSIIRGKDQIFFAKEGATPRELIAIADDDALNILQTPQHFYLCPDISVNEALKATACNLLKRWGSDKWKKLMEEESLSMPLCDVDTVLWVDEDTIPPDALMVRRRHISDADESRLDAVMKTNVKTTVVMTRWNFDITAQIMKCLLPDQLLNDEVINFYMKMLMEHDGRNKNKDRLRSYYFNSFFMNLLMDGTNGYSFSLVSR